MSLVYLIPKIVQPDPTVSQILQRSGIVHVNVEKLFDLWPYFSTSTKILAELDEMTLAILLRYADTLLEDLPTVITGFPGAHYSPEWNMQSGHVTPVRYSDFEVQLLKSGHQANTTQELADRSSMDSEPQAMRDLRNGSTIQTSSEKRHHLPMPNRGTTDERKSLESNSEDDLRDSAVED
jgi:hypothetical protein